MYMFTFPVHRKALESKDQPNSNERPYHPDCGLYLQFPVDRNLREMFGSQFGEGNIQDVLGYLIIAKNSRSYQSILGLYQREVGRLPLAKDGTIKAFIRMIIAMGCNKLKYIKYI